MASLMIGLVVLACKTANFLYEYQKPLTEDKTVSIILFMSFKATARYDSSTLIEQLALRKIEGSFKKSSMQSSYSTRLEIRLLDKNKKELSSYSIDHPLFKNVEYQDNKGQLLVKLVQIEKEEFFIRVTLPNNTVLLCIDEIKDNKIVGQTFFKVK
ncbi:MAG: hypothetical protein EBU52_00050 [Cytophagia bacterium]|nr:hypothetical protein [Cytophagia bacterium]